MRVVGWEDWRFYWPKEFYEFWRYPNKGENGRAVNIRPAAKSARIVCRRVEPFGEIEKNMWENLWAHIIMSRHELTEYDSIAEKRSRVRWVCEKAVVKDAVRAWIRDQNARDLYPADIEVTVVNGAVDVNGYWSKDIKARLNVSVASDGPVSVAAVGNCDVGVEIESVIHWEGGFEATRLQQRDRELVAEQKTLERDEWLTRLWCAKKAAAKMLGLKVEVPADLGGHDLSLHATALRRPPLQSLIGEHIDERSGEIVFTRTSSTGAGSSRLAVSTVRDGDYIIALAFREDHDRS